MAYIQMKDGVNLVRDTWPGGIARIASEVVEFEDMPCWQVVPLGYEGVCNWVTLLPLVDSPDPTRGYALVHREMENGVFYVDVRLQGFLGNHNLGAGVLGSWDRTDRGACKAIVFLNIVAGGFQRQFDATQAALIDLRVAARKAFQTEEEPVPLEPSDRLYFQRRVFTKVNGRETLSPSVLDLRDDPFGKARQIDRRWRVVDRPALGRRLANGRVRSCSPLMFSVGDFVSVDARLDVASFKNKFGEQVVTAHLTFTTVVQLLPAGSVPVLMPTPEGAQPDAAALIQSTAMLIEPDTGDDGNEEDFLSPPHSPQVVPPEV
ncbi:hypothetical protein BV25DRAFT_1843462 [Artomyces pyxidatus]|uniref:Uncharacterized protein n=1 Tax=Artomyces pyxidatus TaxID=48021 RepID=A0ACB8SEU7_9AGAM|nr:hypothetical protein BV25DRAFT_1843462 [Artomyces pyxidatus]